MKQNKMTKIEIPEELYRYRSAVGDIAAEQVQYTEVTKLSWDKGIFLYQQDAEYPMKGLTTPETMWVINLAKRNFIEPLKLLSKWYFWPSLVLLFFMPKRKVIETFLRTYNELTWRTVKTDILKSPFMMPISQELEWSTYTFLANLDIDMVVAEQFSQIFASLIEYDLAYRMRIEDVMTETTKLKLLENPRKEIKRLLAILEHRETSPGVSIKFKLVSLVLLFILLNGKIKKAFKVAVSEIDIRKMQFDEADRYWAMLRRDGYNYFGKTEIEREAILNSEGKKRPKLINR